ncbi:uncharacterized protein SCODWIG_01270 [Saccharomycodes ludwigii]|uniref:Signal recognition particle subunit SRP72 n=1 Tax=Saccharomycodes ludwigii TaxID=36035 RepID=A0A376B4K1_9ASCO|nr:hypothetical protein SCDLUD_001111 [Saccharomycodes ludwigii]KAH3903471.1 hypothetical protein SCDLUD_001111 [Saccharomycodes ludwigii]SSD59509.1 uncharacterized protein SCODWIG_01270 [Saccharomycodes ludwigii]
MATLDKLLSKLDIEESDELYSQIEEAAFKTLPKNIKIYLVALIKKDMYVKAYECLQKYKDYILSNVENSHFYLEQLYIYYKLNKRKEFEDVLSFIDGEGSKRVSDFEKKGILHLRAQFYYKCGESDKAFQIYTQLIALSLSQTSTSASLDDPLELAVNQACTSNNATFTTITNMELPYSYDLFLNKAILATKTGHFDLAENFLYKAKDLAQEKDELSMVELQLAYIKKDDNKAKKQILNKLLSKHENGLIHVLAKNNLKSLESPFSTVLSNLPLVLRDMEMSSINELRSKFKFSPQENNIIWNNVLLLKLFSNSSIGCSNMSNSSSLQYALTKYKAIVNDIVMEPYKTQAKKFYHYLIKNIGNFKAENYSNNLALLLLAVQLQIKAKNLDNAIRLCELFFNKYAQEFKIYSFVLSLVLLQLYKQENRKESLTRLLTSLLEIFETDCNISGAEDFWEFIHYKLVELGDIKNANRIKLPHFDDTSDASSNKVKLNLDTIDISHLISRGITPFMKGKTKTNSNKIVKPRLKKKRKQKKISYMLKKSKRLPKNYDPNVKPDPERWLPLRDRSSYKPSKKEKKLGIKRTQGGINEKKLEKQLDITKKKKVNVKKGVSGKKKKGNRR